MSDAPKEQGRTNAEIRRWYLEKISRIPELNEEWVRRGLTLKERARAAWQIRHEARLEARSMMSNPSEVALLKARDEAEYGNPDGPTFEFLVSQAGGAGLGADEAYESIIDGSYRANASVNRRLGVEE